MNNPTPAAFAAVLALAARIFADTGIAYTPTPQKQGEGTPNPGPTGYYVLVDPSGIEHYAEPLLAQETGPGKWTIDPVTGNPLFAPAIAAPAAPAPAAPPVYSAAEIAVLQQNPLTASLVPPAPAPATLDEVLTLEEKIAQKLGVQ